MSGLFVQASCNRTNNAYEILDISVALQQGHTDRGGVRRVWDLSSGHGRGMKRLQGSPSFFSTLFPRGDNR